jgi:hypothetical protein
LSNRMVHYSVLAASRQKRIYNAASELDRKSGAQTVRRKGNAEESVPKCGSD